MAYRDDLGALRARLTNLEQERAVLRAKKLALDSATTKLAEIEIEMRELSERLATERNLPVLQGLSVASACTAEWDDMVGDDRVRFCCDCHKNVYNVVALTAAEAEAIIIDNEGDLCMRLHQRADGTILTADCPVGRKRKRRRRIVAGVALAAGAGLGMHAYGSSPAIGDVEAQAAPLNPRSFNERQVAQPKRVAPPQRPIEHDDSIRVTGGMVSVPPHMLQKRPGGQALPYPPIKSTEL